MSTIIERQRGGHCCNSIGTVSNDIVLNITSYLGSRGLVSLALTCRRFGIIKEGNEDSLVNKAAKEIIKSKWTSDEERHQLPKYNDESWIELYHELEVLRSPLIFDIFGSHIKHLFFKKDVEIISATNSTVISNQIMRSGKHHVTLRFTGDIRGLNVGIIRPKHLDWDNIKREPIGNDAVASAAEVVYAVMNLETGLRHDHYERHGIGYSAPHDPAFDVDYQRPVGGYPFYIGMTLDLDAGTVIVFKDGQRVGVMKGGLSGEYCWLVKGEATSSQGRAMVSIERGNESQAFDVDYNRNRFGVEVSYI